MYICSFVVGIPRECYCNFEVKPGIKFREVYKLIYYLSRSILSLVDSFLSKAPTL